MNNKDNKINAKQWIIFLPISVLLIVIIILLYNFGTNSNQAAKSVVEDDMTIAATDFSAHISEELDIMTRMGIAFRDLMTNMTIHEPTDALHMIGTLCDNSNAYMVVYCDVNGIGVTQSGIKVNVAKDNFIHGNSEKEQYYAYLQKEQIMQAEAVVSVIPVVKAGVPQGYLLMYYSVSHIRKLFEQNNIYDNAFLVFSVDKGIVITTKGLKEKPEVGTTLIELVKDLDSKAEIAQLQTAMEKKESISLFIQKKKDSRYVICTPIGINDWYIAIGFDKDLYDRKLINEWKSMRNLITCLLVLIVIFVFGMLGIIVGIRIKYMKNNKKLQKEADMDMLTGLYNKMATERIIKQYLMDNPNAGGILFILDIDDFKGINDSQGHLVGDAVLKSIGHYMNEKCGNYNVVGRVGGDEFVIFAKDIKTNQVLSEEIMKINDIFKDYPKGGGIVELVTLSIGAAVYPKDADNFEDLYKAADRALYEAKKNGKNQLIQITE